jgi:hypothetical protein
MRLSGADPALAAAVTGDRSLVDRIDRDLAASDGRPTIGAPSPALAGAVARRRDEAREFAATPPAPPPPPPPRPERTAQREKFEASYYAAAPLFAPKQWIADDYALTAFLRRIGGGNAHRRVSALPRMTALRLRRASLGIERVTDERGRVRWGEPARTWADATAQDIAAVAITLYRHAGPTTRAGFNRCTKGISQGMLGSLLVNRWDAEPMDRRTIERHVRTLRMCSVFYSEQPPAEVADPTTIGPSGHAINLYYWTDRACSRGSGDEIAGLPVEVPRPRAEDGAGELAEPPSG